MIPWPVSSAYRSLVLWLRERLRGGEATHEAINTTTLEAPAGLTKSQTTLKYVWQLADKRLIVKGQRVEDSHDRSAYPIGALGKRHGRINDEQRCIADMRRTEAVSALGNLAWIFMPEPSRVTDPSKGGAWGRGQEHANQATPGIVGE
jgi:hypothetical protein